MLLVQYVMRFNGPQRAMLGQIFNNPAGSEAGGEKITYQSNKVFQVGLLDSAFQIILYAYVLSSEKVMVVELRQA